LPNLPLLYLKMTLP